MESTWRAGVNPVPDERKAPSPVKALPVGPPAETGLHLFRKLVEGSPKA